MQDTAELLVEVQRITDIPDMLSRARYLIRNAEDFLNKNLRLQDMEVRLVFDTNSDGKAALPENLVEVRDVFLGEKELEKVSPYQLEIGYSGWSVSVGEFACSEPDTELVMYYYSRLPSLSDFSSNFLLEQEPEIYAMSLAFKALADDGQFDRATEYGDYAKGLVDAMNMEDERLRMSRTKVRFQDNY